jgi:hypothetical protein
VVGAVVLAVVLAALGLGTQVGKWLSPQNTGDSGAAVAVSPGAETDDPTPVETTVPSTSPSASKRSPSASPSKSASPKPSAVTVALLGVLATADFNAYCAGKGLGTAKLVAQNADGWRCSAATGAALDERAVCAATYKIATVIDRSTKYNTPGGVWQCWRANKRLGALDYVAYCKLLGWTGAQNTGNNAYGWACVGSAAGIDTQDACHREYNNPSSISRFTDYLNKNSWECWG